ncbi:MAG: endolytic transglycosylase MltG [Hyphomicrobiaceae bacterium]
MPTRPPRPLKPMRHEREPRRTNGFLNFLDGLLSFAFLMLILAAALTMWVHRGFDAPGPLQQQAVVVVPKGDSALEVADRLERAGVIDDRRLFMLQYYVGKLYGGGATDRGGLKAGEYEFKAGASVRQVLDTIISGRGILLKFTVPEGLTSRQIVERLAAEPGLTGDIKTVPDEGVLLPDTYRFSRGTSRQEIIDRMRADHGKLVKALWAQRQQGLPLQTPEEAITLASIVEKETGKAEERPRVASVFINRLNKGMRLQSDPTIVYGLVGGQGPLGRSLTRSDIDSKTPYNTYQINGLPPGPICNPGRAAIAAVLNPIVSQDLYLVAYGTGGHTFTSNLKDHNAAVANWRRIERSQQSSSGGGDVASVPPVLNANKGGAAKSSSRNKR